MTVRAVTFDCWGTLIADHDMSRAMARRVDAVVAASGGRLPSAEARDLMDKAWRVHHDAWVDGTQFGSEGMARFCSESLGLADGAIAALCAEFEDASTDGDVDALPGAADTLGLLRSAGVRTALVCDTGFTPGRWVRRFLEAHGLLEGLEFLAFSDEVGVPKPHPRIFAAALEALEAEPHEAVHVGDLLRTDVAGARAVGMRTVRITAVNASGTAAGQAGGVARRLAPSEPELAEADAVVTSHAGLVGALRALGAPL